MDLTKDYIKMVDKDKNELVDFEEFKDFCSLIEYKHQSDEQIRQIFDLIDIDGNGTLDPKEFANAVNLYYNDSWLDD